MTYAASQAKTYGKKPIWLYRIEIEQADAFYTSRRSAYETTDHDFFAQRNVFAGADFFTRTWTPAAIKHSKIRQTSAIGRAETDIILPRADAMAQAIRDGITIGSPKVTIWHLFDNDPDGERVVKFLGRVVGVKPRLGTITLNCENRFTQFRRKALAAVMQRPCRHALYHGGCGLALADFETAATATAWAAPVLTVTEASSQADGYYSGGIVTYNGNPQFIVKHTGTSLRLLGPVAALAAEITSSGSAAVQIARGCDLSTGTCETKFANLDNHGGFPWLTDTPFDGRNPF